jgi:hypothetical protein
MGSAEDEYNFSKFNNSSDTTWGKINSPISDYEIWGYAGKSYNFSVDYSVLSPDNTTMIFYWDCNGNQSDYDNIPLRFNNTNKKQKSHVWRNSGIYLVAVGIFNGPDSNISCPNISYWVPIEIKNNTDIKVDAFYMQDENEGVGCSNRTYNVSILANSLEKSDNPSNPDTFSKYCGYAKNDYSFNVTLNDTFISTSKRTDEVNRTINETTTEINWGDNALDNSLSVDNSAKTSKGNNNELYAVISAGPFTHEWNDIGEMEINVNGFFWDPLDGKRYPPNQSYNSTSILIIPDPKNLAPYPLIGNLQNWGILLSILGLVIFYFTYTKNNVPIKIALFGMKPFYLKSVNSLTGTFIFVTGMYLWFVFGRCPWDIPIVSSMDWLSNMYFNVLYHEYETKQHFGVPYLSILIGMLNVIILSLIIHLIAIPFYKGEFKIGEFLRKKLSSTSAQPELVSYSVEDK